MVNNKLKKSEIVSSLINNFNISEATVNNWIKLGFVPKNITSEQLSDIFNNIKKIKLNSRANKTLSNEKIIPFEYIQNKNAFKLAKHIVSHLKNFGIDDHNIILNAIIFLLQQKGMVKINNNNLIYINKSVENILKDYSFNMILNNNELKDIFAELALFFNFEQFDPLGSLYQYILYEGKKIKLGSYYTPPNIVKRIIDKFPDKIECFLDPCCGTGSFLLNFALEKNIEPQSLIGFDIDPYAVLIAKINLALTFPEYNVNFNIFHCDFFEFDKIQYILQEHKINNITLIATNPPWRAIIKNLRKNLHGIEINEYFTGFIINSLELLKAKRDAIFLLPFAFLNIGKHKAIRKYLFENTKILSIENCGRIFNSVYTPAIIIHLRKEVIKNYKTNIINNRSEQIDINFFKLNNNYRFNINITKKDIDLIYKIYSIKHQTLKNNAEWALGIVTGDNSLITQEKINGYLPIYKGTDITPFKMLTPSSFIKFNPSKLQQVAKNNLYFADEKLIYKFISSKLVFAYDNNKYLTLNSANILVPNFKYMSIKAVLAILNSPVFDYLHRKLFDTHKILRGNLETLPFPYISDTDNLNLSNLVDDTLAGKEKYDEINNYIFKIFDLSDTEIDIIKKS